MTFKGELEAQVKATFQEIWTKREGVKVPEPADLKLSNDAVEFDRATVLYADLSGSAALVEGK